MICALKPNLIADQRGKPDIPRGLENQPITFYLRNIVIESLPQYDSCEIITIPAKYDMYVYFHLLYVTIKSRDKFRCIIINKYVY